MSVEPLVMIGLMCFVLLVPAVMVAVLVTGLSGRRPAPVRVRSTPQTHRSAHPTSRART